MEGKFRFSIDRGGTFTDVYAECPGGKTKVMKLLSEDPENYPDAPTEAIRRIISEVNYACHCSQWDCIIGARAGTASKRADRFRIH